jgi:hypothetical protein
MTVRPSEHRASGTHTFYVGSDSKPGTEYSVQHIRKRGMNRWQCSCPQFFYRCVARRRHCKHIRFVRCGMVVPAIAATSPSEVRA